MRGPGQKRRFSGRDFILAEKYVQGAVKGTLTYEQRQKEAQFKASVLRKTGMNARVVNGSGWTAVYIAVPTPGKPITGLKPRIIKEVPSITIPEPPKSKFPEITIPVLDWNKQLGIKVPEKQIMMQKDPKKAAVVKSMSKLLYDKEDYLGDNGMGRIYPVYEIKDNSVITDFQFLKVNSEEGKNVIDGMTRSQGAEAFKSWVQAAGKNNESEIWKEKRSALRDLSKIFSGAANVKEGDLQAEAKEIFVVYVDDRPAYWSPASSAYAKQINRLLGDKMEKQPVPAQRIEGLDRSSESNTKGMLGAFKGWNNFSPTGRKE